MKNVNDKSEKKCVGCGACMQSCPKKCITMIENNRGFLTPKVDEEECIQCGLCLKKCPIEVDIQLNKPEKGYAAISNDEKAIKQSTSGGVFYVLAKYILKNEWSVYGAVWSEDGLVQHIKANEIDDLDKMRQSKYIQSNINNTYQEAKDDLKDGKIVLFSGTACQIAGLRVFLGKEYENLYTVEIACHGVPSQGLYKKYRLWLENNKGKKIKQFSFRNKEKHKTGEHYMFSVLWEDNVKEFFFSNEDPYYDSFLNEKILRKTCYECKFKNKDRISDITLADFWGIERKYKKFPAQNGVSAVLINSSKGMKIFSEIGKELSIQEVEIEDIYIGNKSLIKSAKISNMMDYSITDIEMDDIKPKFSIKKKIKNIVPNKMKYYLKRLK